MLDVAVARADNVRANLEKTKGHDGRRARYPEFQTTRCREYVHLCPDERVGLSSIPVSDKQYMHLLLRSMIHTKLKLLEAYTKSVRPTYVLEQHFGIPHEGEHVSDVGIMPIQVC